MKCIYNIYKLLNSIFRSDNLIYQQAKLLAKLFGGAAGGVVEKLTGIADKFIQTKDEKAAFEKEMTQIFIQA